MQGIREKRASRYTFKIFLDIRIEKYYSSPVKQCQGKNWLGKLAVTTTNA
jgi:arabinogalactan endo-1,4-beta-galactosidase